MAPGKVKINGTWQDVAEVSAKVNGAWKTVTEGYNKVNGTWQQWFAPGGSYELLETQTLTSATTSLSFTGLGSYTDYKHLQIRSVTQHNAGGSNQPYGIRFNGDSGTNYAHHEIWQESGTVYATNLSNDTAIKFNKGSMSNDIAQAFAVQVVDILDFSSATKNTTIRILSGRNESNTARSTPQLASGVWTNTNAVTSINLVSLNNSWNTGSRFSLYGIKG